MFSAAFFFDYFVGNKDKIFSGGRPMIAFAVVNKTGLSIRIGCSERILSHSSAEVLSGLMSVLNISSLVLVI